jgi:hypothetical protein
VVLPDYSEKPMVHHIEQGWDVIHTQQQTEKTMQVGSQRVSSIAFAKAKELFEAGDLGQINSVEAVFNRQSAIGAGEYTIRLMHHRKQLIGSATNCMQKKNILTRIRDFSGAPWITS